MYNMLTGCDPFNSYNDSDYRDNIKFKEINFNYIQNERLRELNKKLLNRFLARIRKASFWIWTTPYGVE